jgi:uncharacterized protein YkwD
MQGFLAARSRVRPLVAAIALGMIATAPAVAADPLLAPLATCAGDDRTDAPPDRAEAALACLVNHARRESGVAPLPRGSRLNRSAQMKTDLIVKCDEFTHSPCGRPWAEVFREAGYRGWAREILATGSGDLGTARGVMEMWLDSPNHRDAVLAPEWTSFGVGVRTGVTLAGSSETAVMTAHFGRPPSRPSERQPTDGLRAKR